MNKNIVAVCAILAVFGAIFASTICAHADENVSEAFERTLGSQADLNDMGLSASDPAIIEIAPGYSWTYEPEFPSDLKDHITLSIITTLSHNFLPCIPSLGSDRYSTRNSGSDSARTSADADTTVPGGSRAGTAGSLPQLFDEISMPLRVIPKRSARMIFLSL